MFNRGAPIFAAFDILWLGGEDLRDLQLWERKSILEGSLRPSNRALYVDHVEQHGKHCSSKCVNEIWRVSSANRALVRIAC